VAALAVGLELGVQPALFNDGGVPLYSPYDLRVTLPTMLLTHVFGAAIVEAVITGLGFAYLQQRHPEYLGESAGAGANVAGQPTWRLVAGGLVGLAGLLVIGGLLTGAGDLSQAYGADWSSVDWTAVGTMLAIVVVLAGVLLPLAWLLLPRAVRAVGTIYLAAAIVAPIGLITPGFAYGEGAPEDVHGELGYVPQGLQELSTWFSAPFKDYNLPLPFFNEADAPLWRVALGYELAGLLGMVVLGLLLFGMASLLVRRGAAERSTTAA
jgi:hypothetical protein